MLKFIMSGSRAPDIELFVVLLPVGFDAGDFVRMAGLVAWMLGTTVPV